MNLKQCKYKNILFDLDGTISNSSEGVLNSFKAVFEKFCIEYPCDDKLKRFIGPPLIQTFAKFFKQDMIRTAVEEYKRFYLASGIHQNAMYQGIAELLASLKNNGFKIYLATSKNQENAEEILAIFNIKQYFDGIYGANMDANINTKTEVLENLFFNENLNKEECILVGDTIYDAEGALNCKINVAIVLYGFGIIEDFEGMDIKFFAKTTQEVFNKISSLLI